MVSKSLLAAAIVTLVASCAVPPAPSHTIVVNTDKRFVIQFNTSEDVKSMFDIANAEALKKGKMAVPDKNRIVKNGTLEAAFFLMTDREAAAHYGKMNQERKLAPKTTQAGQ